MTSDTHRFNDNRKNLRIILQDDLWEVASKASRLPWAGEKSWTCATHIWEEDIAANSMIVIDLHDLTVKLALDTVKRGLKFMKKHNCGYLCFVTGVGKHSIDGPQIRPNVIELLEELQNKYHVFVNTEIEGRVLVSFDAHISPQTTPLELSKFMVWAIYLFLGTIIFLFLRGLFTI